MGAQSDRLRCEVCQNLILSPINTGFLRYAVATVLTVYGIETRPWIDVSDLIPTVATVLTFTVLKLTNACSCFVVGIASCNSAYRLRY